MKRIVLAECKQEVSSFNPEPSHFEDFRVARGEDLLAYHSLVREEIGGAVSVLSSRNDVDMVPTYGASSNTSGGVLTANGFAELSREFLNALRDLGPVDGAYFCLHGAMQAENELDPEGYLLAEARKILGESVPIVASLDLHGILTDRMLRQCDAVVAYHTYPHVDFFETGARAAELLLNIVEGKARPLTARIRIPVLARGNEMITDSGLVSQAVSIAKEFESTDRGLSAGVMWGNAFTDVPELGTNSFAVTDDDEPLARAACLQMAEAFWRHREAMQVRLTPLEEAVRQAEKWYNDHPADGRGTVVMMDAADATSSGASGDSNAIVAAALRHGYSGTILAPIVDPAAVEQAFAVGVGSFVETTLGGALDPQRFHPLPIRARVRSLSDGVFRSESFGWRWDSGKTCVLQADNVTWVVGSRPVSLFDRSWFYANGQDPKHFDMVIVKSPHCEPHMFADWCALSLDVDAPGATSANLPTLGHQRCPRPIFPLDDGVTFAPRVEIYRR